MKPLRIAWFSPLPDERSSITSSYVSALLLPEIEKECEITLFTNTFLKHPKLPTYHYLKAFRVHKDTPFDLFFYQLEDKPSHDFIRFHLGLMPGVVWFHDALLSTAGPIPILNSPWSDIVEKYHTPSCDWPSRKKVHTYRGPLAYRELGLAAVPVFSSEVAHGEYRRNIKEKIASASDTASYFVPVPLKDELFEDLPEQKSDSSTLSLAIAGAPFVENRIEKTLRAMEQARGKVARSVKLKWLVPEKARQEAAKLVEKYSELDIECLYGESPSQWEEIIRTCDVALHLSFTVFGHREPFPGISLALGREVVVTDFGVHDYLPENLVMKVRPGESEVGELALLIQKLSERSLSLNENNRAFAFERYQKKVVVHNLLSVFERSSQQVLPAHYDRWGKLLSTAKQNLLTESQSLVQSAYFEHALSPIFDELGWLER